MRDVRDRNLAVMCAHGIDTDAAAVETQHEKAGKAPFHAEPQVDFRDAGVVGKLDRVIAPQEHRVVVAIVLAQMRAENGLHRSL
ncbi:hypothetical protein ACEPUD_20800 [Burkholderia ubonensis]|uniref:hypothetical protein n=1 Tax=Burkholderia ubonensis TaxID=101571 RepID=UPI00358E3BA9